MQVRPPADTLVAELRQQPWLTELTEPAPGRLRMVVSDTVRTVFNNGNEYRRLHGQRLRVPDDPAARPGLEALRWHQSERFERFGG